MPVDTITDTTDTSGFIIRAAHPGDVDGLTKLINLPGFRYGTLRLPHQTFETVRQWLEAPSAGGLHLVAASGGTIIAQGSLTRYGGRRNHVASIGMGVHDAHCGQGVGSALLGELVDAADNWLDIRRLELTVFSDNAVAIALYRKFGFATEGEHQAFAFRAGDYVDALAMARLRG